MPRARDGMKGLWADPADVIDAAKDMPDANLECRDFRHAWQRYTAAPRPDGTIERTVKCLRCNTLRTETISLSSGDVLGTRSYTYPEGYIVPDLGRLGGDALSALRLVALAREVGTTVESLKAPRQPARKRANGRR